MSDPSLPPSPTPSGNPWPKVVLFLGILTLFLAAGIWLVERLSGVPGAALGKTRELLREAGGQMTQVARAFHQGTVREEFISHAVAISGTSRLQVATLYQNERFLRSEQDNIAWGLISSKVVVQAHAPVEYTYYVDFQAPWEFRQENKTVTVLAPPIGTNTPAMNVSALTFYTLEGSVWRDENAVRERLRESMTSSLNKRARSNEKLIREIARQKISEFVEKWLGEKFGDGKDYRVKVLFPDEVPVVAPVETPGLKPSP